MCSLVMSVGGNDDDATYLFLVFCGGQLVGRIATSALSTLASSPWRVHAVMCAQAIVLAVISLSAAFWNGPGHMYFYCSVNAAVYGSLWVIIFDLPNGQKTISARRREDLHVGFLEIYGLLTFAPAFGPVLFDTASGRNYDSYTKGDSHNCEGLRCFHRYLIGSSGLLMGAALLAMLNLFAFRARNEQSGGESNSISPQSSPCDPRRWDPTAQRRCQCRCRTTCRDCWPKSASCRPARTWGMR